jgi:4-hydroxy-3-polyprenylbenzoate decarboxylase
MSTLGALAHGIPSHLVHRAADVTMKEGRKLIIVPRETPLSQIHLQNLLTLSRCGVTVVPAMPGFYHRPTSVEEIVDQFVMKVLDSMGIAHDLGRRWKESQE